MENSPEFLSTDQPFWNELKLVIALSVPELRILEIKSPENEYTPLYAGQPAESLVAEEGKDAFRSLLSGFTGKGGNPRPLSLVAGMDGEQFLGSIFSLQYPETVMVLCLQNVRSIIQSAAGELSPDMVMIPSHFFFQTSEKERFVVCCDLNGKIQYLSRNLTGSAEGQQYQGRLVTALFQESDLFESYLQSVIRSGCRHSSQPMRLRSGSLVIREVTGSVIYGMGREPLGIVFYLIP